MKKTILSVVSLLVVSAIGLSACDELDDGVEDNNKTDQEEEENKDFSVSINNLATYYLPSDTISWEDVSLTLTFKDTSINSITLTKGAFDTEELGEEDEFILYTSGLYELSTVVGDEIPEGNYSISYYLEYEGEPYSGYLMSVLINPYPEEVYSVYSFTEPEFAQEYAENLKRVNSEEDALESEFYAAPEYYEIGDDNPFIYKPELVLFDRNNIEFGDEGLVMDLEYPTTYSATASVTHLVDGTEEEVDLLNNEYVSYSNFAFDFTEEAIGEVFTITITLNNFTIDINDNPIPSYSLTVKVEDGYNVYDALDLGRMSLVDTEKLLEEGLSVSDFEYGESYYNIFYELDYSENDEGTPSFVKGEYPAIWEQFYEEKGVSDAAPVNGLFLHGDITITKDDIPSDFLISQEEAETMMGGAGYVYDDMVDSIRDGVIIYNHLMDTEDFTLNGNLFQIDASSLKWCMTRVNSAKAGDDGIIKLDDEPLIYDDNHTSFSEATATLFAFDGYKISYDMSVQKGVGDNPKATAHIINLETNGNKEGVNDDGVLPSGDESSQDTLDSLSSGTITFCKSVCAQTKVENVITKQYLTAFYAEKTKTDYTCFDVNHAKIYDCFGTAFVIWLSGDNVITNSEIKRFGGPVALMFCSMDSTYEENFFDDFETAGFTIGENVIAEAPLGGDEAWFQIYGLSTYLGMFKGLDAFISGGVVMEEVLDDFNLGSLSSLATCKDYGKTFLDEDNKFNLLAFGLNRKISGSYLNVSFGIGGNTYKVDTEFDIEDDSNLDTSNFEYLAARLSSDSSYTKIGYILPVPIMATNTGKIFAPYYKLLGSPHITLIDISDYYYQLDVEGLTSTSVTVKEIEFDEDDTVLYMYYDLYDLVGLSFTAAVSIYDKPSDEEEPE